MIFAISATLVVIGLLLVAHSQSSRDLWFYVSRINLSARGWTARVLASPSPQSIGGGKETLLALAGALLVSSFLLTYKLRSFYGLGTTSDLYSETQMATSWIGGRFLYENLYGDELSIHTYFFLPVLAVFALPLGAVGLLVALSMAGGASFLASFKILRLLGVPRLVAWLFAIVLFAAPLSLHFYADDPYAFHVELLAPALALWLAYFALSRNWVGTILTTVAVISIKEDAPLIVAIVGAIIICEDLLRSFGSREKPRSPVNWQAMTAMLCALAAVPALLLILKLHPAQGYSPGSFARIKPSGNVVITGLPSLLGYFAANYDTWLGSYQVASWRSLILPATLFLAVLRPHLVPIGIAFTVVSWLMQDSPLWPPRIYGLFTFFQILQLLAFSSAWAILRAASQSGTPGRVVAAVLLALSCAGIIRGFHGQFAATPDAASMYALSPKLHYSNEDRTRADSLFSVYMREGRSDESVAASPYLLRYAHRSNPYWISWMTVEPVWILCDEPYPADPLKYELKGRDGRFYLYRKR